MPSEVGAAGSVNAETTLPRRRRASSVMATDKALPSAAPVSRAGKSVRAEDGLPAGDVGAIATANTIEVVPHVAEIGGQSIRDDHTTIASGGVGAVLQSTTIEHVPHAATIRSLVELQRQRCFCIKSQSRCDRSAEAFVARYLGYRADMPEAERAKIWKQVSAFRKKVERDGGLSEADAAEGEEGRSDVDNLPTPAIFACIPIILNSATARASWDTHRANVEKQMRKLARSLPVLPWVESVPGFGDLGLAIIIGEAGDLSSYATKERVWKRLGLAVIAGERQQRKRDPEEAAAHGYNPRRRAEIWTLADSLFRHQWRGEKDGAPAHPIGRYGEVYATRKANTRTREWTPAHREADARRVMTKILVEDLWKSWLAAGASMMTDATMPTANGGEA